MVGAYPRCRGRCKDSVEKMKIFIGVGAYQETQPRD